MTVFERMVQYCRLHDRHLFFVIVVIQYVLASPMAQEEHDFATEQQTDHRMAYKAEVFEYSQ